MLSWHLWQTLSEPAYRNPIFNRIRNKRHQRPKETEQPVMLRYVYYATLLLIGLVFIRAPHFLVMLLQIPAILIVLIVISPLLLPLIIQVIGGYLVSKITTNIHKEKRQYTYDLLCASPDGALRANWLFATGILHRGDWFYWVKSVAQVTYRVGQIILILLAGLILLTILSNEESTRFEALRTLINLSLLLGLYYTSIIQSFVLSLVVGLHATSLDLSQRDASLVGLMTYVILQSIPYLTALTLFVVLHITLPNLHPAVTIGVDSVVLSSMYIIREVSIVYIWNRLTKRLNSTSHYTALNGQVAPIHS